MSDSVLFALLVRGLLFTPLMARNALKSNVTWSSYPFLPPTGASGCLAELAGDARWHEGNSLGMDARRLDDFPAYRNVFALGAYPTQWHVSRRHFRSHLGSIFNYEGTVWSAGRNEGKKLAVVEELLTDMLVFVVASHERTKLLALHNAIRGRVAPVAKKGSIQLAYPAEPQILELKSDTARGHEEALALMPVTELGSLPQRPLQPGQALVHYVPVRSRLREGKRMEWDVVPSVWEDSLKFRQGILVFTGTADGRAVAISQRLWNHISGPTV